MAKINTAVPEAVDIARGNRGFLNRACRFLVQTKIDQFLDCGSGLPTAENTHQIVQRFNDEARVVYVDNDPVVLAHGRALLEDNFRVRMVDADIELIKPNAQAAPGLAVCDEWWPDGPRLKPISAAGHCIVGAVGRKP